MIGYFELQYDIGHSKLLIVISSALATSLSHIHI